MAALGACTAVRHPLSGAEAVLAMVNVGRIRSALSMHADALAALVLSGPERDHFRRAVTLKRKSEFLAGRLAAKSVCMTVRGGELPPLDALDVCCDAAGAPSCVWPDGITQRVSIAHGGAYAVALSTTDDSACGVDIEPASRTLDVAVAGFFHPLERLQIHHDSDARLCWTIREAWGKLTSRGVALDLDRLATIRSAGAWWLAVPRPIACTAVVGAGENARVAIAVAMRRDGSQ